MADQQLTFLTWRRQRVAGLATAVEDGRLRIETPITLAASDGGGNETGRVTENVRFLLHGPGDVVVLPPGAITRRYPTPGAIDHASTLCPLVEFADAILPWRYSPAVKPATGTGEVHPWLVLVVGFEGTEVVIAGNHVTLSPSVQAAHPLYGPTDPYPWAHVQVDTTGRSIARVLSGRHLDAGADYVAVLVPAFDAAGKPRWPAPGAVTVPLYDHWRFHTATPAGGFTELAALLRPIDAPPGAGGAQLAYPRLPDAIGMEVRGALTAVGATDAPLPPEVRADLDALRTPERDDKGRPIIGLPRYGEAWRHGAPEDTTWGATMNSDPRHRGVAGLGLELGIKLQDELAAEVSANFGALSEAGQRIRDLVFGLEASAGLWRRRLPADPLEALWLLGPGLGRVVTPRGTVRDLATAAGRTLPAGLFSSAARRILRPGPARTDRLADGPVTAGGIFAAANRCPPPTDPSDDGVPLVDPRISVDLAELDRRLKRAIVDGEVELGDAANLAEELAGSAHADLADPANQIAELLREADTNHTPAPWVEAYGLLFAAAADNPDVDHLQDEMTGFIERFPGAATETDQTDLLRLVDEPPPERPDCTVVDIDALANVAMAAFDPTDDEASARIRVLGTIDGLDPAQPLAPPEVCVGLDRPVWADVEQAFAEWLMPGVGTLPADAVLALESNPRFVESLLTGLNTQLVSELRWRNIPIATGCTPLRVFWDRTRTDTAVRVDDITGIDQWDDTGDLGHASHRPDGASGRDLVIVIRGQLLLRYPATIVYLVGAEHGGVVDFTRHPDINATRVLPSFQGRIGPDVSFFGFQGFEPEAIRTHWLVFDEPPSGFRFDNRIDPPPPQPHRWAFESLVDPIRVLRPGDQLDSAGTP